MKVNDRGLFFENFEIKDPKIKKYFLDFKDDTKALEEEVIKILAVGITVVNDERLVVLITELEDKYDARLGTLKELLKIKKIEGQGTQKGYGFEDLIENRLQEIAKLQNDTVLSTAKETGIIKGSKKGDFVITINPEETLGTEVKFVLEAKNSKISVPDTFEELDQGKVNRTAQAAMIVFPKDYSPKEAGKFRYYPTHGLVCEINQEIGDTLALDIGYRFIRTMLIRNLQQSDGRKIDATKISNLIAAAQRTLKNISSIKTAITKTSNGILGINDTLETLKIDLENLFTQIEDELKK